VYIAHAGFNFVNCNHLAFVVVSCCFHCVCVVVNHGANVRAFFTLQNKL
jgi:hypothetical protein